MSKALVSLSALLVLFFFGPAVSDGAEPTLAIVDAGVAQSEDAPFVSNDYRFLTGDYLYFTFQIAGFAIRSENRGEIRRISVDYEVTPQDANGIPLAPANEGTIDSELSAEDKNWTPKRRASFLIPSFVAAGDFHVHVHVKDHVANSEVSSDIPFHIGGLEIERASSISVQDFQFFRNPDEQNALQLAAYSAGDNVYVRFVMTGFKTGTQNQYHLSYGLTVLRPDGKPFISDPKAANLSSDSFYPAQYLPGELKLTIPADAIRGEYVIQLNVRDALAGTSSQIKKAFSIE